MKVNDISGQKFGRLTAIRDTGKRKNAQVVWMCKCDCGEEKEVRGEDLRSGSIKSCGCLKKDSLREKNLRLYSIWHNMKDRCYNKNSTSYKTYGRLGVVVCEEWKNSFESFCDWAVSNGYKDGLTIDRIDVKGNYEPTNCRWASYKEQNNNKKNNRFISFKGVTMTLKQWSEELNIPYHTLGNRIRSGWSVEKALTEPVKK